MSPILGIWASSRYTQADTGAMFPLQVITVGAAGASSVTFTNIPNTYSHLQIRIIAKDSRAVGNLSNLYMTFNSDTGANYSSHQLYGDGSSAGAVAATSQSSIYFGNCASATTIANMFGATITDVLDYANTNKNKTIRTLTGGDNNGSGVVALNSGLWRSTSAISSITITPLVANFAQYSQFALYGIRSA